MIIIYKKSMVDKVQNAINEAKANGKEIERLELTREEFQELLKCNSGWYAGTRGTIEGFPPNQVVTSETGGEILGIPFKVK